MIRVQDVICVRFGAPDLGVVERFLTGFGLRSVFRTPDRLYMRGFGSQPFVHVTERSDESKPVGFGLLEQSKAELDCLVSETSTVVIENLEPGGGYRIQLSDPQRLLVDVVCGFQSAPSLPVRLVLMLNTATEQRRLSAQLSGNRNCPSAKPEMPGDAAADGCAPTVGKVENTPAQGPGGFGAPPQTGALPPPPRRMTITSQTFDAAPPLAGPGTINGLGPIFVMPQGLIGSLKPGQTLLGFSDLGSPPPTPDGFSNKGTEVGVMGGSFGRNRSTFQAGQSNDNFSAYFATSKINDPGWRDHANSDLEELYGDIGWRDETTALYLIFSHSNGNSSGGPTPVELLANDRKSSWLWPNDRSDEVSKIELSGEHRMNND